MRKNKVYILKYCAGELIGVFSSLAKVKKFVKKFYPESIIENIGGNNWIFNESQKIKEESMEKICFLESREVF